MHFSGIGYELPGWGLISDGDADPITRMWMDDHVFAVERTHLALASLDRLGLMPGQFDHDDRLSAPPDRTRGVTSSRQSEAAGWREHRGLSVMKQSCASSS